MPKYGYLVVEGPHDVEFAYRLLNSFGLRRVQMEDDLDEYFEPLIPRSFPHGGDLQKRVPVPLFVQSDTHAIAIHNAIGDSRLVATVEENAKIIDFGDLTGMGVILDSDQQIPAAARYNGVKNAMANANYVLPDNPGEIAGSPKLGAFVLPDNSNVGTLEDILLDAAAASYSSLLTTAIAHADSALADQSLSTDDKKDLRKPAGRNKAIVGTIASVLRPGRAVQVSIQDNQWLRGDNVKLDRVKAVRGFLADLFELSQGEPTADSGGST